MKKTHFHLLLWLFGLGFTYGCKKAPDPSPANPLLMSARASYENDKVTIESIGSMFAGSAGPQPVEFSKTEVWLSEGSPAALTLVQTTDQKQIELSNLQADKLYYVAVKGSKGDYWSELSTPILIVPNKVKPIKPLLTTVNTVSLYLSPSGTLALAQTQVSNEVTLTQLTTGKAQKLTYSSPILFRSWIGTGEQIIFEAPTTQRRQYIIYDVAKATFSEFGLPANANVWEAAFSPDGTKIAYTDYQRTGYVWIYDTTTKTDKQTSLTKPYTMVWTGDNRSLLIHRYKFASVDAQEIVQYDSQTDAVTKTLFVTPVKGSIQGPVLSPSGDQLLFSSTLSGQPHVWWYDLQREKLRPVTRGSSQFGWLTGSAFYAVEEGNAPQVMLYSE
ncbi:hypothetical protein GCM10028805_64930 [Spirosoma harenae]